MMEDEETESSNKISTLWKCKSCDRQAGFSQTLNRVPSCVVFAPNHDSCCLFLAILVLVSISHAGELNTSCNLNLLWATYYRLLLLSSLFSLSSLTSPPLCCSLSLIFFFNDETERKKAAFLPPVNYLPVCLSVQLNWRLGDASVVPAGSARTMEAHIADRPSTQPKLNWKSSIFSLA